MTMKASRVRRFHAFAGDESKKQNGFVYVGPGDTSPYLSTELGVNSQDLYQMLPISKRMDKGGNRGNACSVDYYLKESKWREIFVECEKEKPESLESRIAAAQAYLGKDIVSLSVAGRHGNVRSVRVIMSESEAIILHGVSRETAQKYFKNGPEVVLAGVWNTGEKMFRFFNSNLPEIYVPKIKVNGFDAEDMGEYYKFGCAQIQKSQLRRAKEFLIQTNKNLSGYCNRKTESVKIGAGDFTLDVLIKLNL